MTKSHLTLSKEKPILCGNVYGLAGMIFEQN